MEQIRPEKNFLTREPQVESGPGPSPVGRKKFFKRHGADSAREKIFYLRASSQVGPSWRGSREGRPPVPAPPKGQPGGLAYLREDSGHCSEGTDPHGVVAVPANACFSHAAAYYRSLENLRVY